MSHEKSAAIEATIGCGKFQFLLYITCQWIVFAQAWNLVAIVFNKVQPTWTCLDEVVSNGTQANESWYQSIMNSSIDESEKQCAIREQCTNLTYSTGYYSIVAEWELVCDREHILYLIMTIQMAGVLVGAPIFGQVADSFGRKWSLFIVVAGILIAGGASAAAPSWEIYAVFSFIVGFFCGGSSITGYVMMVEFLSQKHRLWVPSIGGWPVAFAILSLMAYLSQNWRVLTVAANVLSLPALALILFIGESPRWSLQAGRTDEAVIQLRRISTMNNNLVHEDHWVVLSGSQLSQDTSIKSKAKKYTYWHLFSTKKMALHAIILSICFFCLSSISFGLTFNVDKLSGSIFMNFFYMACLRWVGSMLTIVADTLFKWYGRRLGAIVPSLVITVAASVIVVLHLASPDLPLLASITRVLLLFSAAMCSPLWIAVPLANNELFPTSIRNIAVAFCSVFNRLGGVLMPQMLYLSKFWKPSAYVAYVILSLLLATLFGFFIPETKGRPLPQQMPQKKRPPRSASGTERSDSFTVYKFVTVNNSASPLLIGTVDEN
jgi:OCT family organic cation transporter-like MFS transporter 4/5